MRKQNHTEKHPLLKKAQAEYDASTVTYIQGFPQRLQQILPFWDTLSNFLVAPSPDTIDKKFYAIVWIVDTYRFNIGSYLFSTKKTPY